MSTGSDRTLSFIPSYNPDADPLYQFSLRHETAFRRLEVALWTLAILFGLGDVLTTLIAVTPVFGAPHPSLHESVALTRWAMEIFGPFVLFPKKALFLGIVAVVWRFWPKPYRVAILFIAMIMNAVLAVGNFHLLVEYGLIG